MPGFNSNKPALLFLLLLHVCLNAQAEFSIGGIQIKSGTRHDLSIGVAAGESDPETFIPLTVLQGSRPGPVILMVAGVHGFEFASILAAKRLAEEIDPKTLGGTFIIVRVAHVSAFEARSPYVNPYDRKNLNRSFPGKADGSQTERIAYTLSNQIIPRADVVFDVHSGDGAEWLEAFIGVYGGPLAANYPLALSLAESFGFRNIVRYKMNTQEQIDRGRSLNRQAVAQGLPSLLVEIGENGKRDPKHIELIVQGFKRVLSRMEMMQSHDEQRKIKPRYFDGTQSVKVRHSGIWTPVAAAGRYLRQGEMLGLIHGYTGAVLETVVSPIDGYALYGLAGPPVRTGESIMTIAKPVDGLE